MTIQEVAKQLNISQDTLRFYEKSGLLGKIKRNASGYRNYDDNDLRRIEFVLCMRNVGISIDVLKQYMNLYDQGDDTWYQRQQLLIDSKKVLDKKIVEFQLASERLEKKIQMYNDGVLDEYLKNE